MLSVRVFVSSDFISSIRSQRDNYAHLHGTCGNPPVGGSGDGRPHSHNGDQRNGQEAILRSIHAVMKPFSDDDVYCPEPHLERSISEESGSVDGFCSSDGSKAKVRVGDMFAVTVDPDGSISVEGGCPSSR